MNMIQFKLQPWGKAPFKKHATDAGWDLFAPDNYIVPPHSISERINLGIAFNIIPGHFGTVVERSSQGKNGINSIGTVVDVGYNGDIHVTLVNNGHEPYEINVGDRICQIIFPMLYTGELEEVFEHFPETERGTGAHGSTGK